MGRATRQNLSVPRKVKKYRPTVDQNYYTDQAPTKLLKIKNSSFEDHNLRLQLSVHARLSQLHLEKKKKKKT